MTESTTFMTLLPASRKVVDLSITNQNGWRISLYEGCLSHFCMVKVLIIIRY